MPTELKRVLKAVYALVFGFLSALGALLVNDTTLGDISAGQWVYCLLAGLVLAGGVFGIRNAPPA